MAEQAITKPAATEAAATESTHGGTHRPDVDILEDTESLRVVVDLPGVRGEDIDVRFDDGALTVHGKVSPQSVPQEKYLLKETPSGDFFRTFQVGELIDASNIRAEHNEGVLTLHLPKVEAVKPRKIPISVK